MIIKLYKELAPYLAAALFFLYLLLSFKSCQEEKQLINAIEDKEKILKEFVKIGTEFKDVKTQNGLLVKQNKVLELNSSEMAVLVDELKMTIKNQRPQTVIQTTSIINVHDTVRIKLPCDSFDVKKSTLWYSWALSYRPDTLNFEFAAPVKITQTITERSRLFRKTLYNIQTKVDNPHVQIKGVSTAIVKQNKGFKILPFVAVGLGSIIVYSLVR